MAVIPAAGSGVRMGYSLPKAFIPVSRQSQSKKDRTILEHSVGEIAGHPLCSRVVVCVPSGWYEQCVDLLSGFHSVSVVVGGATRQQSVHAGIEYLATLGDICDTLPVLVHDAARCCISQEVIERVLVGVELHGAVTAAVKVMDSLCYVDSDSQVVSYADREALWAVQTPQGFLFGDLLRAHRDAKHGNVQALDDAALVARLRPVSVVTGDRLNIKVTEPRDLRIVEQLG